MTHTHMHSSFQQACCYDPWYQLKFESTPASGGTLLSNSEYPMSSPVPMLPPSTNMVCEVFVNQGLLKVFCEEDRGVDASVMRHVQ